MEPQSNAPPAAPVVLKKYGNRRLYDTSSSRYVTLVEVEAMVQGGRDIVVVDAKTGEDLTKEIMVQLILERDGARAALPTSLLKQAIKLANSPLKDGLVRAMQEGVDGFLSSQRAVVDAQRALMVQMGQLNPWVPPSSTSTPAALWNPFPGPPPPQQAQTQPPQQAPTSTSDLDGLKAELAETQALVRKLLEREVKATAPVASAPKEKAPKKKAKAKKKT